MSDQPHRIKSLELRIKELEEENNSLSNRVEEMLLLSLINESFESITDETVLIHSVLEKISILKDIAYCACYDYSTGDCKCIVEYCSVLNTEACQGVFKFSDKLIEDFNHEPIVSFKIKERPDAIVLTNKTTPFYAREFLALTFSTRFLKKGVFVFISNNQSGIPFSNDLHPFNHIIQLVIDKWERLILMKELQQLNSELEDRVDKRTSQLQQSEEKYRQLFNMANDAIFIWELKNNEIAGCIEINDAVVNMTGYTLSDWSDINPFDLLDECYLPEEREEFERLLKKPSSIFKATFKVKHKLLPLEVHSRRFSISDKEFVIAIGRDITEQQAYENSIVEARNKAVESEKLKSAFLANMSHEIRTPMNAIVGFSELLCQDVMSENEVNMYANIIFKNSMHLLNLINDIVDYSKIEAEQVKIFNHPIYINELISDLSVNMISMLHNASKNHIDVLTHTPLKDADAKIITDGTRLRQVLSNLINNAIKFTDSGFIEIGYELKEKQLEFFVRDTGIGIAPEHQDKVFERFVQVGQRKTVNIGGTGLGLAICSHLVGRMNGKMCLESKPGEGSNFYFTIPYITLDSEVEGNENS
ncbi:sensor histidine kinase [Carboxylicivirga sp. RSCT41]|uniref:sensor histidine kinase n=1 Tax=Carboxylicivirga agarovorans TaxID=3417570 RepID=UPI003D334DB7